MKSESEVVANSKSSTELMFSKLGAYCLGIGMLAASELEKASHARARRDENFISY